MTHKKGILFKLGLIWYIFGIKVGKNNVLRIGLETYFFAELGRFLQRKILSRMASNFQTKLAKQSLATLAFFFFVNPRKLLPITSVIYSDRFQVPLKFTSPHSPTRKLLRGNNIDRIVLVFFLLKCSAKNSDDQYTKVLVSCIFILGFPPKRR
jgi:hypothetical protein